MSNQQPMSSNEYEHSSTSSKTTMQFDENGVCHACNFNELKWEQEIDWDEREKERSELCDQYRTRMAPMIASSEAVAARIAPCSPIC